MKKTAASARPDSREVIHRFIVHLWRERTGLKRFVWRGSLTDARKGGTRYFQSIRSLAKLLTEAVGKMPKE